MKLKYIIGILALFLLMVSTASASTTFYLTETNVNNKFPNTVPNNAINISVTYDGSNIIVQSVGTVENPDIKNIGYNLSTPSGIEIIDPSLLAGSWNYDVDTTNGFQADGFGRFITLCTQTNNAKTGGPITIPLGTTFGENIPDNANGYEIAVHISFAPIPDGNGYVIDPEDTDKLLTSLYVSGHIPDNGAEIPEFPSIALPVAALIGIMFIVGRKKE